MNFFEFIANKNDPLAYCMYRWETAKSEKGRKFWKKMAVQYGADDDRSPYDYAF